MKTHDDIKAEVEQILRTEWSRRKDQSVPEAEDIQLGNDAMELDATVLYADMEDSTGLVIGYKDWFAAEVYKAYLRGACDIIKNNNGVITAFDGDRVMAVYIGNSKNTSAAKTALQINYLSSKIINPALKKIYPKSTFQLQQAVGVDTGSLFIARTGVRGSNDLVWVGRSANYAAKLCGLRNDTYASFITEEVFNKVHESAKYGGNPKQLMWKKSIWSQRNISIYRSSWHWKP
ncbi:adenylate/guanylate cyclase domain-containing protein [Ruficoccus amylovorans]|uniref:Adenylate/guanylate cyclase domain-containing protein n=1 Tax=Ruficoccus amylovorans TaxID=1804625 RepID=A0A842H9S7_9BACT|nr:adenylate/guanylate cyclase domain-containing protein [Ruficoccus amylovorans]MBC2592858.1 adenylate/guanylate cyclase domain-containing protein [Ruficoccus amylovorans]